MENSNFFKNLEQLQASLPNLYDPTSLSVFENVMHYARVMKPEKFIVINDGMLEEVLCTPEQNETFAYQFKIHYKFEIIDSCKISEYAKLIKTKDEFKAILPETVKYTTVFGIFSEDQSNEYNIQLVKPIVAIVIDGDSFQEIKYTPVIGECESWLTQTYEVEYTEEILNACKIDEALAQINYA